MKYKKIREELLKKQRDGRKVTLYLTSDVYEDFKAHCKPLAASAVIDELMKEYMASTKGSKKNKYFKKNDR